MEAIVEICGENLSASDPEILDLEHLPEFQKVNSPWFSEMLPKRTMDTSRPNPSLDVTRDATRGPTCPGVRARNQRPHGLEPREFVECALAGFGITLKNPNLPFRSFLRISRHEGPG